MKPPLIKPAVLLLLLSCNLLFAQTNEPYAPTEEEMLERYRWAMLRDSLSQNIITKYTVDAHWAADGKSFWYENKLKGMGSEYIAVDAVSGKKTKLSASPSQADLPEPETNGWRRGPRDFVGPTQSPDGKWEAFMQNGNLFIKSAEKTTQLTSDGSRETPYGSVTWSPDGKYLAGYKIHPVEDSLVHYVLTSVPGTTRGQLVSRPYKQPGDPFTSFEPYVFLAEESKAIKVAADLVDFGQAPGFHWIAGDTGQF